MCWRNFLTFPWWPKKCESRSKIALFSNERHFEIWFPKKKTITFLWSKLSKLHKKDPILHVATTFSLKQWETRTSHGPIPHPLTRMNHVMNWKNAKFWAILVYVATNLLPDDLEVYTGYPVTPVLQHHWSLGSVLWGSPALGKDLISDQRKGVHPQRQTWGGSCHARLSSTPHPENRDYQSRKLNNLSNIRPFFWKFKMV